MKILLLASGSVNSSLSARIINIGYELVKRKHEVILLAPSCDKYTNFKAERVMNIDGIRVVHPFQFTTRSQSFNFIPYAFSAIWHIWLINADIIHLYKPTPLTVTGLIGRLRRIPVFLDMDDIGSLVMIREGNPAWKSWIVHITERVAARYSTAIITVSSYLYDYYSLEFPSKPLIWIPNGVRDVNPGLAKHAPSIVFIGSINNLAIISPLVEALPDVIAKTSFEGPILRIIGDGDKIGELRKKLAILKLTERVEFSDGWVTPEEIRNRVTAGSIGYYCVPDEDTYKAASSQKVFNYLSLKVIPLVNAVGDLPYYVGHGKCGYIVNKDLVTILVHALQNEEEHHAMLVTGEEYLRLNFFWDILAGRIEQFYVEQSGMDKVAA